jgi:ribonuclease R
MGRKSDRKPTKNKKRGGKSEDAASLARRILQFLDANFGEEFSAKQIIKNLEIRDSLQKGGVEPILFKLVDSGAVSRSPRNYYSSTKDPEFIVGRVDFVNARFAFIVPEDPNAVGGDIMVKEADLKQALDGANQR